MSMHLDLIQQLERDVPFRERFAGGAPSTQAAEVDDGFDGGSCVDDEAMSVVQRIFLQTATSVKVAVFAGLDHDDGSSRISMAVAEALARNSFGSVCLIQANLRTPVPPELFGSEDESGLTDALLGDGPIRSLVTPMRTEGLWLLSSDLLAAAATRQQMNSERIKTRLTEIRSAFSYVIVHAPPLAPHTDTVSIAQLTDGMVLVIEAGDTRREAAQTAVAALRSAKVPILGAILNNREFPIPEYLYRRL